MENINECRTVLIKNLIKESFYRKKKINVLTAFFISHKNDVKIFLEWIFNQYRTTLVKKTLPLAMTNQMELFQH